jgi:hypothetical protein
MQQYSEEHYENGNPQYEEDSAKTNALVTYHYADRV